MLGVHQVQQEQRVHREILESVALKVRHMWADQVLQEYKGQQGRQVLKVLQERRVLKDLRVHQD